jgi:hypothetical protein
MRTGFVTDERCVWHDPGNYALMLKPGGWVEPYNRHIENPDPKRRLLNLATASGLLDAMVRLPSRDASTDELHRLHSADHAGMARMGIDPKSTIGVRISECGFDPYERDDGLHPFSGHDPDPHYNQ